MGVTGRSCCLYHASTLYPNLDGLVDAPATAKCLARKKLLALMNQVGIGCLNIYTMKGTKVE